jgi:hypothetical protein
VEQLLVDRDLRIKIVMKIFTVCMFFCVSALSIEPIDDYYASDLLDAVDQAKSYPHHYDYSTTYRYKRTTAQSIELNRLNLTELDETSLKSEAGFFQESEYPEPIVGPSENKPKININSVKDIFKPNTSLPKYSSYTSKYGVFTSSGIQSNSNLVTTTRP